jgi:hypothetical protein
MLNGGLSSLGYQPLGANRIHNEEDGDALSGYMNWAYADRTATTDADKLNNEQLSPRRCN